VIKVATGICPIEASLAVAVVFEADVHTTVLIDVVAEE
jgi:hypothetical protein